MFCFGGDFYGLTGKSLEQRFRNTSDMPSDSLLRWHFRQAVLINMRGVGEPVFEHDFPPGSDIMGDIINGPSAAERMESELFGRIAVSIILDLFLFSLHERLFMNR